MAHENLEHFAAQQSTDDVKTDLELTCLNCGQVVCDIEHGDTFAALARTAEAHICDGPEEDSWR